MARKRGGSRRKNFSNYLKGVFQETQALGTLNLKTGIRRLITDVVEDTARVSSIEATWSMGNWTPADGKGPIYVGYAHSNYTLAQIEEWIENAGAWSRSSLSAKEISTRMIRQVGTFASPGEAAVGGWSVLNDGKPIKTKLNWLLMEGQTVSLWYYNGGTGAVATTDPNVVVQGHANIWMQ